MNIVYIRTSSKEQNPENQLKDIFSTFKLIKSDSVNKVVNPLILEDKQTAWCEVKERDSFNELFSLIKKGKVNNLYVWDLDRLYRDRKKLISFFKLCKAFKCNIHSHRQDWLEDLLKIPEPFNEIVYDLMLQIMGWINEEESKKKSDRVKNAVKQDKKGVTISYKGNKWGRKPYPKQTIDKILKAFKEGDSLREIAKNVETTDKHGNMKNVSKSGVHKTLVENYGKNYSKERGL